MTFAERYSPMIVEQGVVPVPNLLLRNQGRLGITHAELTYLLHVLARRWGGDKWPWISVGEIARATGASERIVRTWKASLEARGYIRCTPRTVPGLGRRADEHDLTGLFTLLERIYVTDWLTSKREALPTATFLDASGLSTAPSLSTERPVKKTRARAEGNSRARPAENVRATRKETAGRGRKETAGVKNPTGRIHDESPVPESDPGDSDLLLRGAQSTEEREAMLILRRVERAKAV